MSSWLVFEQNVGECQQVTGGHGGSRTCVSRGPQTISAHKELINYCPAGVTYHRAVNLRHLKDNDFLYFLFQFSRCTIVGAAITQL